MSSPPTSTFPRALALLVAGAFFMENLDGTIIATAAPAMAESFGVRPVDINVVMTAYLVAVAVLVPASGWLGERFGSRTIFLTAVAIFTASSALCAVCTDLTWLVIARIVQGLGGALMVPVGRLVVLRAVSTSQMLRAIAFLTWPGLVAPVIAPLVGGLLTDYLSWRWIFVINVPLGIAAFLISLRLVPQLRSHRLPGLDWVGFLLVAVGLGALVTGMDLIGHEPPNWLLAGIGVGVGLLGCVVAVWHLRRHRHPMLDLTVLRIRAFRVASYAGTFYRLIIVALPFLLPLMFQVGFGWSPVTAGVLVLFLFLGNVGIKPATTPLLRTFGFRTVLVVSTLGGIGAMVGMAFLTAQTPYVVVALLLTVSGVFRSVGFTAYNSITYAGVGSDELPSANALSTTLQQIASGLGVALGALALRVGEPLAAGWSLDSIGPYRIALLLLAALLLLCSLQLLGLAKDEGSELTAGAR
ncbi:MFS transporter [Nakamurella alba]|uniref:MFS transporter n=1 Tax=Nakamurella alba TaxID=2665158 RepID=UPI002AC34051|nr:MFS transporter [Nakamurella alba]